MPTLTLSFNLPEEQEEADMAVKAMATSVGVEVFDNLLRARLKYDAWLDARLTAAEEEGVVSLVEMLRIVFNEMTEG